MAASAPPVAFLADVDDRAEAEDHSWSRGQADAAAAEVGWGTTEAGTIPAPWHTGVPHQRQPTSTSRLAEAGMPEHAPVKYPTSYLETLVLLVKGCVGSGIFAMGDAFRNAGLVAAFFFTFFIGTVCVYAQHQLITTAEVVSRRRGMKYPPDYAETAQHAFRMGPGPFPQLAATAETAVNMFIIITQLGYCCVYFVFVATNMKQVLDQHIGHVDVHIYMAVALLPILVATSVRNLKYLTPVSLISNVIMCAGIAMTLWMCVRDGLPPLSERRLLAEPHRWPLFFGTVVYSFESISMVMPLRNEMRAPRDFSRPLGVMNVGSVIIGMLLALVGSVGYLKFGDDVEGSLTLNLDQSSVLCQVLKVGLCAGIIGTYPLQAHIPVKILWPSAKRLFGASRLRHPVGAELAFRAVVVLFTFLLAEAIPRLGLFISLVGALSSTSLAFVFPPLLDWAWRWRGGLPLWRHVTNVLILLMGLLFTCWGTYAAIKDIVEALTSGYAM